MKAHITPLIYLLSSFIGIAQIPDSSAIKFAQNISADEAKKHLSILASDEYEGRETGKEGQKKAAAYIAAYFKSIGLETATDESYLQKFPLTQSTSENFTMYVGNKKFDLYQDYYVFPYGNPLKYKTKNILFLGYGISDEKYNDYKNVDVKDKILLVLDGEPLTQDSISLITGTKKPSPWNKNTRMKLEAARKNGAAAIFIINEKFETDAKHIKHLFDSPVMKLETTETKVERKIFRGGISIKAANDILSFAKHKGGTQMETVENIQKKIIETKAPVSLSIKTHYSMEIKNTIEKISSENVLGVIKGSELPNEYIFISAHYDHIGVIDGKVYNGADDDGSGTVGMMGIAKGFIKAKEAGVGPKRTIVFLANAGEEKGLLGSSYYVEHPIFALENTVCDLNIDMIGRGDEAHQNDSNFVYIIGSDKISTDLHKINELCNSAYTHMQLDYTYNNENDPNRFYYRSDHYNFARKGIPIIFYFNGTHADYHQEGDEVSKINFPLLVKRSQLTFYTAWEIANRKERIKIDVILNK